MAMQALVKRGLVLALAAGAAAADAKPGWPIQDEARARAGAKRTILIALKNAAPPSGAQGRCRLEAIVLGAERGRGPVPGAPTAAVVPCAKPEEPRAGERWVPVAALRPGSLWRLHLSADGKPRDLEPLRGRVGPIEPVAEQADRRQLWRLLHAGSGDNLLVDTDDVAVDGERRTAWVKRNLEKRERGIVQVLTRVEFDCAAHTQTLHAWYARTGSTRVDSEGVVPEEARRAVPVLRGTDAGLALALLCAPRRQTEGS